MQMNHVWTRQEDARHGFRAAARRRVFSGRVRPFALAAMLLLPLLGACRNDPVGVQEQPKVCFSSQVLPIIQNNCAKSGCHAGTADGGERLALATASDIQREAVAGKPFDSRLYTAITDSWAGVMPPPPNAPLTMEQRTTIYLWILQGADTTCSH
jgi:hypothetical protein